MVFDLFIVNPFELQKPIMRLIADWILGLISFKFRPEAHMAKSSAKSAWFTVSGMCLEIWLKNMLNRVGERQLPCGTPHDIFRFDEMAELTLTWNWRSLRKVRIMISESFANFDYKTTVIIPLF